MFMNAVCVIFLIKLRWPKMKSLYISKHLKASQKYSVTRRIFNFLLGVWKGGQT